jgi:hypothetical protein
MFGKSVECSDDVCTKAFCEKCASSELVDCEYCENSFCKECLKDHTPDCKTENEEVEEETCDDCGEVLEDCTCDIPEGMYFNKEKTICILQIGDNSLNSFIEQLSTLRTNYVLDKELSTDGELVWMKKA